MDNDRTAPKRPVKPTPNEDNVRQAEDAAIDELIQAMNAFHLKHGLLSDEFEQL